MAEILSQKEIDSLLGSIDSSNIEDLPSDNSNRRIRIYDFRRPNILLKSQIHDLSNLSELVAKEAKAIFSKYHKLKECKFHVASVDQLTTEEYYRSIPSPTFLYKFEYSDAFGCIDISPELVFRGFLQRKISYESCIKIKEFETFDIEVCKNLIISQILDCFHDVLQKQINDSLPKINNLTYVDRTIEFYYIAPTEVGALITLEMEYGGQTGLVDIFLPKPLTDLLIKQEVLEMRKRYIIQDGEPIGNAYVKLGSRTINDEMKKDIRVGSIVELNTLAGEPLELIVDNKPFAIGEVVVVEENFALRITELLDENKS